MSGTSGPPPRLSVGVIGTGRVGSVLGAALARAGHTVVAASGVSAASHARAAALLPEVPLIDVPDVAEVAELVLVAVPDDQLAGLVRGLAAHGAWRPGQVVVHTSGAVGLSVFEPATQRGAVGLALHPAMTFAGRPEDLARLDGAVFGVTAPELYRPVGEALVLEMGGEPVWVPEAARARYHAALTHAANHLVTLTGDAADLLRGAGVDAPERLLAPLMGAALDNSLRLGDAGLTGPVARGDVETVARHVRVLAAEAPDVLPVYRALALRTVQRAVADRRLAPSTGEALVRALDDSP